MLIGGFGFGLLGGLFGVAMGGQAAGPSRLQQAIAMQRESEFLTKLNTDWQAKERKIAESVQ